MAIKKIAREFTEREFPKVAKKCDRQETFDFELIRKACEAGLNGIFIDKDYGRVGYGYLENAFVMEEFWRVDPGLGGALTCVYFGCLLLENVYKIWIDKNRKGGFTCRLEHHSNITKG
jgi:alkylation response protein AidB-like acyl-CoA dehydrogenase